MFSVVSRPAALVVKEEVCCLDFLRPEHLPNLKAFEAHPTKAKHGQELGAMGSWQLTVTQWAQILQFTLGVFGSFQSEDARKRNNILGQQKRIW